MLGDDEEPSARLRAQEPGEVVRHGAAIVGDEDTASARGNVKDFDIIESCETSSRGGLKIDAWLAS